MFRHKIHQSPHSQGQTFLHRVNHMGRQFTRAPWGQQAGVVLLAQGLVD
ncbi:hypothetical protein [Desulfovibrio sp. QI0442]